MTLTEEFCLFMNALRRIIILRPNYFNPWLRMKLGSAKSFSRVEQGFLGGGSSVYDKAYVKL
jgi:hypothetical protein